MEPSEPTQWSTQTAWKRLYLASGVLYPLLFSLCQLPNVKAIFERIKVHFSKNSSIYVNVFVFFSLFYIPLPQILNSTNAHLMFFVLLNSSLFVCSFN